MSNVSLVNGHIDRPKMTDEEVVKALELCFSGGFRKCEECPLKKQKDGVFTCIKSKQIYALDLINRQKAEIEKLQNSIKEADNYFSEGEMGKGLAVIINLVKEMTENTEPTKTEPKPKQAKWLINPDGYYPYCSECGAEPEGRKMTKFCPECGAYMGNP